MGKFVKIAALGAAAFYGGPMALSSLGGAAGGGGLLSTLSTGLSVFSTIAGGISKKKEYEAQAKTEKFNATTREIERKKNLIRSLSLSNVRMGAGGIGTGGSAQNLALEDIRAAELDQATADVGTRVKIDTAVSNGRSAQTFSLLSAGADVGESLLRKKRRGSV